MSFLDSNTTLVSINRKICGSVCTAKTIQIQLLFLLIPQRLSLFTIFLNSNTTLVSINQNIDMSTSNVTVFKYNSCFY